MVLINLIQRVMTGARVGSERCSGLLMHLLDTYLDLVAIADWGAISLIRTDPRFVKCTIWRAIAQYGMGTSGWMIWWQRGRSFSGRGSVEKPSIGIVTSVWTAASVTGGGSGCRKGAWSQPGEVRLMLA